MNNRVKKKFQDTVWDYFHEHGRHHLPWRTNPTPYRVLVSEIMLQQTQVDRVIPFFKNWVKSFPNFKRLASAKQSDILRLWKGLGYNSRALRLHRSAKIVSEKYHGRLPRLRTELESLPGVGPYTAGAIRAFAFNQDEAIIETNIRRIFIYHFFQNKKLVHDQEILSVVQETLPIGRSADWYGALMDYGTYLAGIIENPNRNSKHYTKQKKFEGSDRQIRGKILEYLLEDSFTVKVVIKKLDEPTDRVKKILEQLEREGFIKNSRGKIFLQ
ncbi:MAG: A/G-specific adenine glycosylase [Candidatus Nomurabacteria bacterium]|nr:A/G-specific adenine glycosylase [Candidatus Nomurabacteria bacterium]